MIDNIRMLEPDECLPDSMYTRRPLEWFVGRTVKIAFEIDTAIGEHMWVTVTHIEEDHLVGTLTNDPAVIESLQHGDEVTMTPSQVEAVHLTLDEWLKDVRTLTSRDDYFNPSFGYPKAGSGIELFQEFGYTPRQALKRWRDWTPTDEELCLSDH